MKEPFVFVTEEEKKEEIPHRKQEAIRKYFFTHIAIFHKNMLVCLPLDIIWSLKLIVFLEFRSQETVCILEQTMYADKYPCIFSRQIEAIFYIFPK